MNNPTSETERDWITVKEAAAQMQVGRRTLDKAIRAGKLRAFQVNGRDLRIHRLWLMDWANALAEQPIQTSASKWRAERKESTGTLR